MASYYPHGDLEVQGVGSLISVVDISFEISNGAEQESTMKSLGAGFSHGPQKMTGSFTVKNPTTSEKNWLRAVARKEILGFTFKLPDSHRIPVTVAPSSASFKDQETGASTTTVSWVGFTAPLAV